MNLRRIAFRLTHNWLTAFVDPRRALGIAGLPRFVMQWREYNALTGNGAARWQETYPCLSDWVSHTPFDAHYFYQAAWASRKLAAASPKLHVDIGSSVMMIGVISAMVPTMFVDYRPIKARISGLVNVAGDLLALPFASGSLDSLSCMHVIEHVGLGRYGDPLDPLGSVKAARELVRVLAPGGRLLLSTPLGRERVQFNAHRVFAPTTIPSIFDGMQLEDFAMVDDVGVFHTHANLGQASDCEYACGMFEFIRQTMQEARSR